MMNTDVNSECKIRSITPVVVRKFYEEPSISPSSSIYSSELVEREIAEYERKIQALRNQILNDSIFEIGEKDFASKSKAHKCWWILKKHKWKFITAMILFVCFLCLLGVLVWYLIFINAPTQKDQYIEDSDKVMHEFRFKNNCPFTIWPGIVGKVGKYTPAKGGFELKSGVTKSLTIQRGWSGQIWASSLCDSNGHCLTGDCGNKIECNGANTREPVTTADFSLDDWGGIDYFEITLINGFNLPLQISPIEGTFQKIPSFVYYNCAKLECLGDVASTCPDELSIKSSQTKVACKSSCLNYYDDQHCCRGIYGTSSTCKPAEWTFNSAEIFKNACPDAITYIYDNSTRNFMCVGSPVAGYEISFCK